MPCSRWSKVKLIVLVAILTILALGGIIFGFAIKNKVEDKPVTENLISEKSIKNLGSQISETLSGFDYFLIVTAIASLLGFFFLAFRFFKAQIIAFIRR